MPCVVELDPRREVGEARRHPALEQVRRLDQVVVDRDQREAARPALGVGQERDLLGLGGDEEAGPALEVVEVDAATSAPAHSTATGLTGQPVPPGMRSGLTVSRNSQRSRSAQATASGARCRLSMRCRPMAAMPIWWIGNGQSGDRAERHAVGDAVAAEHRDAALVQPRQALRVQPGQAGADRVEPATGRGPPSVAPGRDEQEVAGADGHALAASAASRSATVIAASPSRNSTPVHAGTSSSTPRPMRPSLSVMTVLRSAPSLRTSLGGPAVVHLAPHEHVRERVDVGEPEPVHLRADVVAARLVARDARCASRASPDASMWWCAGNGVSADGCSGRSWARLTISPSATSVAARGAVGVGLVVERAGLVVGAPPAPVLERLEELVEIRRGGLGEHRCRRPACSCPLGRLTSVSLPIVSGHAQVRAPGRTGGGRHRRRRAARPTWSWPTG